MSKRFHVYFKVKKIVFKNQLNQFQTIQISKTMKKLSFAIVAFLGVSVGAMAQSTATHGVDVTINSVVMIRATDAAATAAPANTAISVGAPTSNTPGDAPAVTVTDGSALYLQYTSVKASAGTPRTIKAAITAGTVPAGFAITATAGAPAGTGDTGSSNGSQSVSATDATMITAIGSGYTGITGGSGSNVTYAASIATVADLVAAAVTTLTVTYTLSAE